MKKLTEAEADALHKLNTIIDSLGRAKLQAEARAKLAEAKLPTSLADEAKKLADYHAAVASWSPRYVRDAAIRRHDSGGRE